MERSTTEAEQLSALVQSLEQATFMAKQLPSTAIANLPHIYSSLHRAHSLLSTFLSNSSSAPAADEPMDVADEPMDVADDDEGEADSNSNSRYAVDKVEEKMRGCFIRNKRPKRRLSPSSIAVAEEERRFNGGDGFGEMGLGFDPLGNRLRALDLVYQFHG